MDLKDPLVLDYFTLEIGKTMSDNRKINILFVSNISQLGGAERTLLDMLRQLDREKYAPHIATSITGQLSSIVSSWNIPVVCLPFMRLKRSFNPFYLARVTENILSVSWRIAKYIREKEISIVHANNDVSMLYAGIAGMLAHTPCIWHCRDFSKICYLHRCMATCASRIIAVSQSVAEYLRKNIPQLQNQKRKKLAVVLNGIDISTIEAVAGTSSLNFRTAYGVREDEILICTVGQLVPWKNHQLFLESAELIAREVPSAKFIIVGGDMFNEHHDYVERLHVIASSGGLKGKVIFTGYRDDALCILAQSDILIHTSAREPFGRIIVEAMILRKPIVAINSCGPSEIIRSGIDGLLVEPDNPRAITDAVIQLIKDSKLSARLVESAYKRACDFFDIRRMVTQLESIYAELTSL